MVFSSMFAYYGCLSSATHTNDEHKAHIHTVHGHAVFVLVRITMVWNLRACAHFAVAHNSFVCTPKRFGHDVGWLIGCRKAYLNKIQQFLFESSCFELHSALCFSHANILPFLLRLHENAYDMHTHTIETETFFIHLSIWYLAKRKKASHNSNVLLRESAQRFKLNANSRIRVHKWLLNIFILIQTMTRWNSTDWNGYCIIINEASLVSKK